MLEYLRTRLQQGTRTSAFPEGATDFPSRFRGLPVRDPAHCVEGCRACVTRMPSGLLTAGPEGNQRVDLGSCLFAPEEADTCPSGAITFSQDHRMATRGRADLITPTGEVELARALDEAMLRLFKRSLRLRSVVAGSCNGCESELVALSNVVFDMARFGIQFVASPRHADGIVVTGAINRNMLFALRQTLEATPPPRLVIAVGACALSGGPFRDSPEVANGLPSDIEVDLHIPGCPPHPLTVMDGLLRLLGRLEGPGDRSMVRRRG
jgi:Ni,Fe-hydrogenase III small subunit/formate hydrogenlyase subunit 6/NADH:ubiquinone oxidoreductase subunit I